MFCISRRTRTIFAIAVAALLAACAQRSTPLIPPTAFSPAEILPQPNPPKCKGQKDTKNYAKLTVTLSTNGGSFCIPEFGGFGGSVKYPSAQANPPVKLKLISSTTNYDHQPELGKGTAIFYLQLALSGAVSFGTNVSAGGGLTSSEIVPGQPYTAYGAARLFTYQFRFGPCYAIATKGKYGGVIGGIGKLLKDQYIPGAASGVLEFYSGKQTGKKC